MSARFLRASAMSGARGSGSENSRDAAGATIAAARATSLHAAGIMNQNSVDSEIPAIQFVAETVLKPDADAPIVRAQQIAVARQRPQREEFSVTVVAQIEDALGSRSR